MAFSKIHTSFLLILTLHLISLQTISWPMRGSQSSTEEIGSKLGAIGADTIDSQKPNIFLLHHLSRYSTGKSTIAGDFMKARSSGAEMENEASATVVAETTSIQNQFRQKRRNRRRKRNLLTDLIQPHMNS